MQPKESETKVKTSSSPRRPLWKRILRVALGSLGCIVVLVILVYVSLSLYLTPKRLAHIASEYADRYLDADIDVKKVSFSMFSSFPHFELQVDSAVIISNRLRGLTPAQRQQLPADCDTLASFVSLNGSVNPFRLLVDRVSLRELHVKGLALNLVAYNDSINNYDILPDTDPDHLFVMPRFEAGEVSFTQMRPMTYFSAATKASATLDFKRIAMTRRHHDTYDLKLDGLFGLSVHELKLLHGFPFGFSGNVKVGFYPFRISFEKYNVALGNVRSQVDLSLELGENNHQLTSMKYSIGSFHLLRLFEYLPARWLPNLEAIRSNVSLEATVSLTAPYKFSSETLPSFRVDFRVPASQLTYTLDGKDINLRNIGMAASLDFNGDDINSSQFNIENLTLASRGLEMNLRGRVTDLFTTPEVEAIVEAKGDLRQLASDFPMFPLGNIRGRFATSIHAGFSVAALMDGNLADIPLQGTATLEHPAYTAAATPLTVACRAGRLVFRQQRRELQLRADFDRLEADMKSRCGIKADKLNLLLRTPSRLNADLTAQVNLGNLTLKSDSYKVAASDLQIGAKAPIALLTTNNFSALPVAFDVTADNLTTQSPTESMKLALRTVALTGDLQNMQLKATLSGNGLKYTDALNFASLNSIDFSSQLNLKEALFSSSHRTPDQWLAMLSPTGSLKIRDGKVLTATYPALGQIRDLNLSFTPDHITLHRLAAASGRSAFSLAAQVDNYKEILRLPAAAARKVKACINLDIDTFDINQVAVASHQGSLLRAMLQGKPLTSTSHTAITPAPEHQNAVLIPAWLDAAIGIHAGECTYTNLHLLDLNGHARLSNGVFTLDSLRTRTDFGSAFAKADYNTTDSLDMAVTCDVRLDTINVVTFFQRFHTLLEMMPQLANLSGNVSLGASARFSIFPDMIMNLPSLTADISMLGRRLKVHQSDFIHKVCRYLLIHTDDDLHIQNLDVKATIHDNQVELYPFIFEVNRYKLSLMGENDFAGNLYYHIAVLRAPLPLHFGVNITGTFDKYHISFGGARFRHNKAMQSMRLLQNHRIDLVQEAKWFMAKFMQKAAESGRQTDLKNPDRTTLPTDSTILAAYRSHLRALSR